MLWRALVAVKRRGSVMYGESDVCRGKWRREAAGAVVAVAALEIILRPSPLFLSSIDLRPIYEAVVISTCFTSAL